MTFTPDTRIIRTADGGAIVVDEAALRFLQSEAEKALAICGPCGPCTDRSMIPGRTPVSTVVLLEQWERRDGAA